MSCSSRLAFATVVLLVTVSVAFGVPPSAEDTRSGAVALVEEKQSLKGRQRIRSKQKQQNTVGHRCHTCATHHHAHAHECDCHCKPTQKFGFHSVAPPTVGYPPSPAAALAGSNPQGIKTDEPKYYCPDDEGLNEAPPKPGALPTTAASLGVTFGSTSEAPTPSQESPIPTSYIPGQEAWTRKAPISFYQPAHQSQQCTQPGSNPRFRGTLPKGKPCEDSDPVYHVNVVPPPYASDVDPMSMKKRCKRQTKATCSDESSSSPSSSCCNCCDGGGGGVGSAGGYGIGQTPFEHLQSALAASNRGGYHRREVDSGRSGGQLRREGGQWPGKVVHAPTPASEQEPTPPPPLPEGLPPLEQMAGNPAPTFHPAQAYPAGQGKDADSMPWVNNPKKLKSVADDPSKWNKKENPDPNSPEYPYWYWYGGGPGNMKNFEKDPSKKDPEKAHDPNATADDRPPAEGEVPNEVPIFHVRGDEIPEPQNMQEKNREKAIMYWFGPGAAVVHKRPVIRVDAAHAVLQDPREGGPGGLNPNA